MRTLIQRVSSASVAADGDVVGSIGPGLCVFAGVTHTDDVAIAEKMADKLWGLRVFDDGDGVMNVAAADAGAMFLVVSQFTLYGDARKGRRPSWSAAASPEHAEPIVHALVAALRERGATVEIGQFRAHMDVALVNDGPVTLLLELP